MRIVSLFLMTCSAILAIIMAILWFRNPHLTQMQLLIRYWYLVLSAFVLMTAGGWLYRD
jgi:hypothetical protein